MRGMWRDENRLLMELHAAATTAVTKVGVVRRLGPLLSAFLGLFGLTSGPSDAPVLHLNAPPHAAATIAVTKGSHSFPTLDHPSRSQLLIPAASAASLGWPKVTRLGFVYMVFGFSVSVLFRYMMKPALVASL